MLVSTLLLIVLLFAVCDEGRVWERAGMRLGGGEPNQ